MVLRKPVARCVSGGVGLDEAQVARVQQPSVLLPLFALVAVPSRLLACERRVVGLDDHCDRLVVRQLERYQLGMLVYLTT